MLHRQPWRESVYSKALQEVKQGRKAFYLNPQQLRSIEDVRKPFIDRLHLKGYGEYRDISFIKDNLKPHIGDGSTLDPIRMIMEDTGYSEKKAQKILSDFRYWTGDGYSGIRARDTEHHRKIAERIEQFLVDSPKYEGITWRGIGVSKEVAEDIFADLNSGISISQHGLSSWSTEFEQAVSFATENADKMDDGVRIIFRLENKTGVSIKHIAGDIDNEEVIMSSYVRYLIGGKIEKAKNGIYLVRVIEV